ncbi:MAG: FadR/GntR family transcriptional regulator, partial [Gaiellaceae bacterium]
MSDNLIETPIARRKTYELVADRLLELIAARRLQPGDAVPSERELVEAYRVGRSSVREALRMLESRGLIAAQGSGAFAVAHARNTLNQSLGLLLSVDEADFHELFEVRRTIEVECAGLA